MASVSPAGLGALQLAAAGSPATRRLEALKALQPLQPGAGAPLQRNPDEDKKPFVELAPGTREKDTRDKTGLLGDELAADDNVRAKKSAKNRPPSRQADYLYHSTTYRNLLSIRQVGLDPNRGGTRVGASDLAPSEDLRSRSLEGSKGMVHGATQSEVALHYACKFDAREKAKPAREVGGFSVALRFRTGQVSDWEKDTEDSRGNYKTGRPVPVADIEYLDIEQGWRPLAALDPATLAAFVEGTRDQHETLEAASPTRAPETGPNFAALSRIDLSSLGPGLDASALQGLIAAISRGDLPNLRTLILTRAQITPDQQSSLAAAKADLAVEIADG